MYYSFILDCTSDCSHKGQMLFHMKNDETRVSVRRNNLGKSEKFPDVEIGALLLDLGKEIVPGMIFTTSHFSIPRRQGEYGH